MAVLGMLSVALEVPDLDVGVRFYRDAGLVADVRGDLVNLHCPGQDRPSIVLVPGKPRKRLHHISLRAENLGSIAVAVETHGGRVVPAPAGFEDIGLWVEDPHGMLIQLVEQPPDMPLIAVGEAFAINAPGRIVRRHGSAVRAKSTYAAVKPLRLGHVLVFSPDVPRSVAFVTDALGMGLADRAQDIIAFTCARRNSDHHVIAFAKSTGVGFHHASFEVNDPDEVGRGGEALLAKTGLGDWGFGRHTIGSNFFHYIQDPWGSWFEYYSDMDHIEDYALWTPTNYDMEDSLASWGPSVPHDFVRNYEVEGVVFTAPLAVKSI
ncbi:VOC family protein [Nitrospirillum sp. BR 11163]|uniref:VOC family protein n=1 Tax=Nitrospirillum sp. BR 11163 TaxID=3104323 RepID=UPI002AFDCF90|nr:VOC family protein [Nitrospirillum sp. BR 11163]MEA1672823.1 VOC family protein [Nitrospirillum sp. BR 11163]